MYETFVNIDAILLTLIRVLFDSSMQITGLRRVPPPQLTEHFPQSPVTHLTHTFHYLNIFIHFIFLTKNLTLSTTISPRFTPPPTHTFSTLTDKQKYQLKNVNKSFRLNLQRFFPIFSWDLFKNLFYSDFLCKFVKQDLYICLLQTHCTKMCTFGSRYISIFF